MMGGAQTRKDEGCQSTVYKHTLKFHKLGLLYSVGPQSAPNKPQYIGSSIFHKHAPEIALLCVLLQKRQ